MNFLTYISIQTYMGVDKSLARPGRKQANVSWWLLAYQCCWYRARPWHASELVSFLLGLRTYQHPGVKEYRRTRGVSPLITNLGARWRWAVNITPGPFTPGKEAWHPLHSKDARWVSGRMSLVPWCCIKMWKQNFGGRKEEKSRKGKKEC